MALRGGLRLRKEFIHAPLRIRRAKIWYVCRPILMLSDRRARARPTARFDCASVWPRYQDWNQG